MKRYYNQRHQTQISTIEPGIFVLPRKGLQGCKAAFEGPHLVIKTANHQGVLKVVHYQGPRDVIELGTTVNIVP